MRKKQFMNIVPQEMVANGERTLRYKGSDGKFHGIAPDGDNTAQSYAVVNNPHAYEIVATGEFRTGTATYKPVTCDGSATEIPIRDFGNILLQNPNTTVITRIWPLDNQIEVIRVDLIKEDKSQITLLGKKVMVHVFLGEHGDDYMLANPNS